MKILNKVNFKSLPLILSVTIVILFLAASYLGRSLSDNKSINNNLTNQNPDSDNIKTELSESELEKINIAIFENAKKTTERGDVLFKDTGQYHLIYFSGEDEFLISILSSPFENVRSEAEKAFLDILKIDEETACLLKVRISSPIKINPELKGNFLPLSFCR